MSDTRLWVGILAGVCFLAGAAAGILFAHGRFATAPEPGPFAEYAQLMTRSLDLEPERQRLLRELLARYEEDLERIRDRHTADLLSAMEPELREKGREYASLLRDQLIPADRRSEFDRLAAECVVDL